MEHSPERAGVGARAAAGGRRLPGHAGRARADRRRRDDQAGARPRRAEHPRADGLVGRRGRAPPSRPCATRRAARAASARARALGALEPRRRLPRERRRRTCRCSCRSRRRRAWMPQPRSPRSTASTASSSGRPTSPPRWACSVSRPTRTSSAAVLRTFEAVRAAGKPVGVNAFDPGRRRSLPRRRRVVRARRRRRRAARPRLRGPRRAVHRRRRRRHARVLLTSLRARSPRIREITA